MKPDVSDPSYAPSLSTAAKALLAADYEPEHVAPVTARFEDPSTVRKHLYELLVAHAAPERFEGTTLLDFGCGSGASVLHLAQMFPKTEIVGVELEASHVAVAQQVIADFDLPNARCLQSPSGDALPDGLGQVDHVVCNAVIEHLLPAERRALMPMLWGAIRPGGMLFITETPHRWFPRELHTTGLWGINYLPARLAGPLARRSGRVPADASWPELLRRGVRGTSVGELRRLLGDVTAELVPPTRSGLQDHVDLWLSHSGGRGATRGKRIVGRVARRLLPVTGEPLIPSVSVAFRKGA